MLSAEPSRFGGITSDMGTHDRKRRREFLDLYGHEARAAKCVLRRSIRRAPVPHSAPERFNSRLNASQQSARRCGNVLNEDESAAGFEDTKNLIERPFLIHHAAQDQGADCKISGRAFDWQVLGSSGSKIDVYSEPFGLSGQVLVHIRVRLDADPSNTRCWEVAEICPCSRTDLQNSPGKAREQSRFVGREITVRLVPASGHEPGEQPQANRAGAAADSVGGDFALAYRGAQCPDYCERGRTPP